jgi:G3E family GTPase
MDNTPTSPGEVTTLLQVLKMEPEKPGHLHHHHHHHQQHHHHHQHHPHHSCGRKSVDIRELLDCPVCTRPMYPPIHQVWRES